MTGLITTHRTATNVSGSDQELDVSVDSPPGAEIIVSDKAPKGPGHDGKPALLPKSDTKIHLKTNGTTDIWITISAPEVADGQYFGRITLDPKKKGFNAVTLPVAFNKHQGIVTLSHVCAPTTFAAKTGSAHCNATVSNFASVPANVGLTVTNLDKGKGLDFTNIVAPATSIKKDDGVQWSGTLTPALAPTVNSIAPGGFPYGYLGIGGAPNGPATDESAANFTVPAFMFGGEVYNRIGVVSDGYVIIGGASSSADIVFKPSLFPSVNRPNNVVAPVWTDLNPAFGGAIRVVTGTIAGTPYIGIDFAAVRNYDDPVAHTYQVWIRTGTTAASEQVSMVYGAAANAGVGDSGLAPGMLVNWGAENRDGTSGKNLASAPANSSTYLVTMGTPTPGGSATIEYDASAKKAGTYKSVASMTSDITPGTTQVVQTLTATP
jgi:hypothetical protein